MHFGLRDPHQMRLTEREQKQPAGSRERRAAAALGRWCGEGRRRNYFRRVEKTRESREVDGHTPSVRERVSEAVTPDLHFLRIREPCP